MLRICFESEDSPSARPGVSVHDILPSVPNRYPYYVRVLSVQESIEEELANASTYSYATPWIKPLSRLDLPVPVLPIETIRGHGSS